MLTALILSTYTWLVKQDIKSAAVDLCLKLQVPCDPSMLVLGSQNVLRSDGAIVSDVQSTDGKHWTFDHSQGLIASYRDSHEVDDGESCVRRGERVIFKSIQEVETRAMAIAKDIRPNTKLRISQINICDDYVRWADGVTQGDLAKAIWLSVLINEDCGYPSKGLQKGMILEFHPSKGTVISFSQNWTGVYEPADVRFTVEESRLMAQTIVDTYIDGTYTCADKGLVYVIPDQSFGSKFPEQKGNPKHLRLVYWFQFGKNQVNVYIDAETGEVAGGDFRRDVRYKKL